MWRRPANSYRWRSTATAGRITRTTGTTGRAGRAATTRAATRTSGSTPRCWRRSPGAWANGSEADPDHAGDYRANTRTLVGELKALDKEFSDGLAGVKNRTFITTHAAFGYLAERYGLDQHGISGVDPESEPSPARLAALQRTAHKEKVTTIFFETLADPRTAETLAKDLGLKTSVLDPLEGVKDPGKDDYFSVMRQNLANLRAALGTS